MSHDAYRRFREDLARDPDLRQAFKESFQSAGQDIPAKDVLDFAQDRGYTFSLKDALEELPDETLQGVVGGTGTFLPTLTEVTFNFEKISWDYLPGTGEDSGGEDSGPSDWATPRP